MDNPTPQEIRLNMELMKEDIATLKLSQDKGNIVLFGKEDIRLPGLLSRMENAESALKSIETQKTLMKGALIGLGVQGVGIVTIIGKIFLE